MTNVEEEFDINSFYNKLKKVRDGYELHDPVVHYKKDVTKLLRLIKDMNYDLKNAMKRIDDIENVNKKLYEKKYNLISVLSAVDACLPEPCDPASLPEDYQFEVTMSWGMIKTIRRLIKGR
jgi:hypothetical protein